ncbi:aminomethyltransferase family protein [Defluviimonas sp. SAOS-178_SWC]|uniref:aminomethyltransferase family protein n=1 Tax=Defluviimonas sp. SAOS-178_SWC TaxID=3121287 RepID=UPI003221CB2A
MSTSTRIAVADFDEPGWDYGIFRSPYHDYHRANGAKFCVYNGRLMPVSQAIERHDGYKALRQGLVMLDTGERPTEIAGPDAEKFCNKLFARDVSKLKPGRAGYGLLLYHDGNILCDGILMRLAADKFWYVQADGPVFSWFKAHSEGMDVEIRDPQSWVTQVQGPRALDMLTKVLDGGMPEPFGYYGVAEGTVNGQPVIVSRTGYTAEIGFEFYTRPDLGAFDGMKLWNDMLEAGKEFDLKVIGLDSLDARRIEAGILNNVSDMDETMNPYQAGLGAFIKLDGPDFIGRNALEKADRRPLLSGLRCKGGEPLNNGDLMVGDETIGRVTAAGWSPYLGEGVAIVRLKDADRAQQKNIQVRCTDGALHAADLVSLPMYDVEKKIPRGLDASIPKVHSAA